MNTTIPRDTLVAAVDAAIDSTRVDRNVSDGIAAELRTVAQTTKVVGENFNTSPACIAGQAFIWPFDQHGCSRDEHDALVLFGIRLDQETARRLGRPYTNMEVR